MSVRLAIADPPYPPHVAERYDLTDGGARIVTRSRARRYYGNGTRPRDERPADYHPDAGEWDDPARHRALLEQLDAEFDGWAIATTPDGLEAYRPLPISHRLLVWVKPSAPPTSHRIASTYEVVIVSPPPFRRMRFPGADGRLQQVPDVLVAPAPGIGFVGAKPAAWTRWILDALGHDPDTDTVTDMFPGSGSVAAAVAQGVLL